MPSRTKCRRWDLELIWQKREQAFLENPGDTYAIYQLKRDVSTADIRFMNSEYLQKKGIEPQYENYELVYTGALTKDGSQVEKLENLYRIFNIEHPQDFTGHRPVCQRHRGVEAGGCGIISLR